MAKHKGSSQTQREETTSEETTTGVTDTVKQAASSTADSIQGIASTVADTAQNAVSGVVDKVQDVTGAVADQAQRVTTAAADQVETLADTVYQQAAPPNAPELQRNVAEKTVNVLDRTAEYLREGDVQLILEDLRSTIRRNPGRAVLLGLAAGYLARSTFFGSTGTSSSGATRPAQPFTPSYQPVPVSSGDFGMGVDSAYPVGAMSGSTVGLDMSTGADMDALTATSSVSTADNLYEGQRDSGIDTYSDLASTGTLSSEFSDSDTLGSDIATIGALDASLGTSDFGTLDTAADSDSLTQNDVAADTTLNSDNVFLASVDTTGDDMTGESLQLGGESLGSDSSSTGTMPSDDLLARWDGETRDRTGES